MKRMNKILLLAAFFIVSNVGYCGTVDPPYEVGTWQGFLPAAVTYTFDDNCYNQYLVAVPMFDEFDFDGTFFTVTDWVADWTPMQNAAAEGHEIASHTVTHARLLGAKAAVQVYELSVSQEVINANIPGNQCLTIAYPNCRSGDETITSQYYIAGRNCSGGTVPSSPDNLYEIGSSICGSRGSIKTTADFIEKDEAAAAANGWAVFLVHGIDDDGGYSPLASTILRESLEYLDVNRDTYWMATFLNVVKYISERDDVSVTETSAGDTSITLQVTDTLDDTIYNQAITIRRPLPAGWGSATVKQNNQSVESSVVLVDSTLCVMFDVVPDGGEVEISKAAGDTTPPDAPTNLTAFGGDYMVTLNWDDNTEPDLDSYNVYRDTTSGGPYTRIATDVPSSDYVDTNVTNGTTYYYVVTAVDVASNESNNSNEASATPEGGGGGTMHVDSIVVSIEYSNPVSNKARAIVVIKDNLGAAVEGATVSGTFSGGVTDTDSAETDGSGTAILESAAKKGLTSATFCVDNVTHDSLTYEPGANVETCDSI